MDFYYIIFVVPALLLTVWAQFKVKSTFAKYSKESNQRGVTGAQAAAYLLKQNNITDVKIGKIAGDLTDNYNPTNKVLSLSESVCDKNTIAAVGVAAHETGHAIQHATNYGPMGLRSTLVPVANIGSQFGPLLAIIGAGMTQSAQSSIGFVILKIGLLLFAASVAFYLVTLPVEFNASNRALQILKTSGALTDEELKGVKKVLSAAAMTYVAAALTAVGNFLRIFMITKNRKD